MAKVKGPLFSIAAIGTIDNKLIYRSRKSYNDVKKYTKTINPNTPGQQTQKGYFKNAIEAWSIDGYSAADKFAWDQFAKTKKVITSGINRFTSLKMIAEKEGFTWSKLTNCIIYDVVGTGFKVDIDVGSDLSGVLYLGTSKYSMLREFIGVFSVNKYTFTIIGLDQNTKYFFYIKNSSVGESARTGIYHTKTITGAPPVIIIIGQDCIDRPGSFGADNTIVSREAVANENGKINKVYIFAVSAAINVEVGIFYKPDPIGFPNNLSTRSYALLGNVATGYNEFDADLDVAVGDIIGFNRVDPESTYTAGLIGIYYKGGDYIPCTNVTFFQQPNYASSQRGTGIST